MPDLPRSLFGEARAGMGLWNSVPATLLVEGGIFVTGVLLYLGATRAVDRAGRYGVWTLIGFLVLIYASQFSGAVPPDASTVALAGLLQWLFVLLGFWTDRHRKGVLTGGRLSDDPKVKPRYKKAVLYELDE